MICTVHTMSVNGIVGSLVRVECYITNGLPNFDIVGLPDAAVKEAINAYKDSQVAHVSDAVYNDMVYGMDRLEKRINPTKE